MNTQNRPNLNDNSNSSNHPIVLCFVTEKGHELGKSALKQVDMAPAGTEIGVPLAPQLPSEMLDLMTDVLTTIHAEGLVPVWSYDRLEIEVGSALLMSGNQPTGTPYELKIPVRLFEEPPQDPKTQPTNHQSPLPEDIMEPSVETASSGPSNLSSGENKAPFDAPNEESTYSPTSSRT